MSWDQVISNDETDCLEGTIFKGGQFMVQVEDHPSGNLANGRYLISIWTEDDESWFRTTTFASFWLPDLLNVLSQIPKEG